MPLFNNSNEVTAYCNDVVGIIPLDKKQYAFIAVICVLLFQILVLAWKCRKYKKLIPPEQRPPSILSLLKDVDVNESKQECEKK